jgi:hypothetical protein
MLRLPVVALVIATASVVTVQGQQTDRAAFGFSGPVRSVRTTVTQLHPDPRPPNARKLVVPPVNSWSGFDVKGHRIESDCGNVDGEQKICKCTFDADRSETCVSATGNKTTTQWQDIKMPDGGRERVFVQHSYTGDSFYETREEIRFDSQGREVSTHEYVKGKLYLQKEITYGDDGDSEMTDWKIYDEKDGLVIHLKTLISEYQTRFDRWAYDPEGLPAWHIALNDKGELLYHWYRTGYKPLRGSSDSLGIFGPELGAWYRFDDQGSGQLEKTVHHRSRGSNPVPYREEHYGFDGQLDEKIEIKYIRDRHGNWTSRTMLILDRTSNQMIEVERDTRVIEYY